MSHIKLESGRFGWDYYIIQCDADGNERYKYNEKTGVDERVDILIQTDTDYPSIASMFGWDGEESDIAEAQEYLDDNDGMIVEDPGYFDTEN